MYSIEYDKECDYFVITYDDEKDVTYIENNKDECKINMDNEYGNTKNQKLNMMWIDDIKKHYNCKDGDVILLNQKQNANNCFYVMRGWRDNNDELRVEDKDCYDIAIDDDGYVIKRYFQYYKSGATKLIPSMSYVIRANCVYNDYVLEYC
jgi:hypothetical protein